MRWLRFERCIPIQYGSSYDSFESLRERKEKRERAGERAARGDCGSSDWIFGGFLSLFGSSLASHPNQPTLCYAHRSRVKRLSNDSLLFQHDRKRERKYEKCAGEGGPARSALETAYQMNGNRKRLVLDGDCTSKHGGRVSKKANELIWPGNRCNNVPSTSTPDSIDMEVCTHDTATSHRQCQ